MLRRLNVRPGWLVGVVALASIGIAMPAVAQPGAIVRGRVVNERQEPIVGAKVTIKDTQSGRQVVTESDSKGEFFQIGLNGVPHELIAEKNGITSKPISERLRVGDQVTLELVIPLLMAVATSASSVADLEAKVAAAKDREAMMAKLGQTFEDGIAASNAGRHVDAIAKFNEGIVLSPNCFDCYSNLGYSHAQLKQYPEAEAAYMKAVELKPDYQAGYMGLASVYSVQGKRDLAEQASAKATELSTAGGGGGSADALYSQGVVLFNGGKIAEAKALFQNAVKSDPNHAEAHYMLGMSLAGEDPATAVAEFETYLKLAPEGPNAGNAGQFIPALKSALGR